MCVGGETAPHFGGVISTSGNLAGVTPRRATLARPQRRQTAHKTRSYVVRPPPDDLSSPASLPPPPDPFHDKIRDHFAAAIRALPSTLQKTLSKYTLIVVTELCRRREEGAV